MTFSAPCLIMLSMSSMYKIMFHFVLKRKSQPFSGPTYHYLTNDRELTESQGKTNPMESF